jgi:hypothetical protein
VLELLWLLLRYLHIVGFAMLLGGFLTQYLSHTLRISVLMRVGLSGPSGMRISWPSEGWLLNAGVAIFWR